jgi:hypothetical protein
MFKETVKDAVKSLPILELLAIRKYDGINPLPRKAGFRPLKIEWCHSLIGNDHDLRPGNKS